MGGIGRNTQQMLNKLEEFITTGTVTKPGIDFPAKPKLGNLQQAMKGLPLSGPKIGPFSRALQGDKGAAAIDRHVAHVLFGEDVDSPTIVQHRIAWKVCEDIAKDLGWDTRQVQAALWAAGKEMYGQRGKTVETYEQYLKQYEDKLNAYTRQKTEKEKEEAYKLLDEFLREISKEEGAHQHAPQYLIACQAARRGKEDPIGRTEEKRELPPQGPQGPSVL